MTLARPVLIIKNIKHQLAGIREEPSWHATAPVFRAVSQFTAAL
jgi:hypothetical protein